MIPPKGRNHYVILILPFAQRIRTSSRLKSILYLPRAMLTTQLSLRVIISEDIHNALTAWQWEELMRCLKVLLQQESIIFGMPGSAWHQSQEGVHVYIHMMNTAPSCGKICSYTVVVESYSYHKFQSEISTTRPS